MTTKQRRLILLMAIVVGLILVSLGGLFFILGLDKADKAGSIVGAVTGVLGLALSGVAFIMSLHDPARVQRVDMVESGASIDVIDGVAGSVRLGAQPVVNTSGSRVAPHAATPAVGEQSVTNTKATGSIRVIRGVGDDLDINP
jgi:hypothetical protein